MFLGLVQVVLLLFILMSILSSHGWYMCTHGHPHISSHGPLPSSSHSCLIDPFLVCVVENPRKWWPIFRCHKPPKLCVWALGSRRTGRREGGPGGPPSLFCLSARAALRTDIFGSEEERPFKSQRHLYTTRKTGLVFIPMTTGFFPIPMRCPSVSSNAVFFPMPALEKTLFKTKLLFPM